MLKLVAVTKGISTREAAIQLATFCGVELVLSGSGKLVPGTSPHFSNANEYRWDRLNYHSPRLYRRACPLRLWRCRFRVVSGLRWAWGWDAAF
jgi:hypothetical protein